MRLRGTAVAVALAALAGCRSSSRAIVVTTAPVGWPIPVVEPQDLLPLADGVLVVEPVGAAVLTTDPSMISRVSARGELPTLVAMAEPMMNVTRADAELVWLSGLKPARIRAAPIAPAAVPR